LVYHEQAFSSALAGTMGSLLVVIVSIFVICGALSSSPSPPSDNYAQNILMLSHAAAFVLLLLCVLWLCFRLKTHGDLGARDFEDDEGDDYFDPRPDRGPALFVVVVVIALLCAVFCVRYLFTSVDGVVQSEHISRTFIGLVLLPISTHASNNIQTLVNARKNKMDQAIEMTLGASVNITLVTLPVLILTGWAVHQPMSMQFQLLETIILAGSVFLTTSVVSDGKSNYFEGLMCLGM
jgi:Ca2+:H+ antiporter